MTEHILQAEGLRKSFGDFKAVDDVSIHIDAGQCVALLGPNGAGKTTTVEMLEGMKNPDAGSIQVFGRSWSKGKKEILERMGVLLQETYLYKKLTVRETLDLFASFYKESIPVSELLKQVQLEDKAEQRLEKLSGGQKQRVYLACGLINKPELFFLDEPTTGLDPQARRMIWDLLSDLKTQGCSLLLTTHYMEEAEYLADQVMIMDKGKIMDYGSPDELIRKHCGADQVWVELIDSLSEETIEKIKSKIKNECTVHKINDRTVSIQSNSSISTIRDLSEWVEAESNIVHSIQMKRSNLEDVFLKLTGRSIRDA